MMNESVRKFEAKQAVLDEVPLLIGIIGPPGGGKTWSSLRLATGMRKVRPGPIVLIDTERGRASKYAKDFDFLRVPFDPPFVPADFLTAVKAQLPLNPAAIIIDSLSDEHEGEGGVLDWHDQMVPKMSGNEWAAWSKPKASRRTMINGFLQIKVPLIFTFRAREKTKTERVNGKNTPVNIGYQPIAPAEVVYSLDLTCILPPKADGVPIWKSDKIGEDFIIKLPNYLRPFIKDGQPLSEQMGEAFASWASGNPLTPDAPRASASPQPGPQPGDVEDQSDRIERLDLELTAAAAKGWASLKTAWEAISDDDQDTLRAALNARHKPAATEADKNARAALNP